MPQAKQITFNEISVRPVIRQGIQYLSTSQISECLGYKKHTALTAAFHRNRDEFSPDMYLEEETTNGNLKYKTRYFNKRGVQLLCFFASTPKAKAFRKWVLDVLEEKNSQPQQPQLPSLQEPVNVTPAVPEDTPTSLTFEEVAQMADLCRQATVLAKNMVKHFPHDPEACQGAENIRSGALMMMRTAAESKIPGLKQLRAY